MSIKTVDFLLKEVAELKKSLTEHLIQSGGIQAHLRVNTWLTGVILVALLAKFVAEWFKNG